jgi:TetR/AcrR family transcriptional regulator
VRHPPPDLTDRLRAVSDQVLTPRGAASIDEVAAVAEIPRTTLYYYFSGRDALVDFLLVDKVETVAVRVAGAVDTAGGPADRLAAVLRAALDTIAAHPTLCTVLMARLAVLSEGDALAASVDQAVIRPLAELLSEGTATGELDVADPETTAHALYGAVSVAAMSRYTHHGSIDAAALAEALVPRLVAGVHRDVAPS